MQRWEFGCGLSAAGESAAGEVRAAERDEVQGLRLKAEIEVKGQKYPVRWACRQKLNEDGSLTLRSTVGLGPGDETGA